MDLARYSWRVSEVIRYGSVKVPELKPACVKHSRQNGFWGERESLGFGAEYHSSVLYTLSAQAKRHDRKGFTCCTWTIGTCSSKGPRVYRKSAPSGVRQPRGVFLVPGNWAHVSGHPPCLQVHEGSTSFHYIAWFASEFLDGGLTIAERIAWIARLQ